MALPNYHSPIFQEAVGLSGSTMGNLRSLQDRLTSSARPPSYSPGNPKPIGRQELLDQQRLQSLNTIEGEASQFMPYLQQAQQRAALRTEEDMKKYRRDYRNLIMGNGSGGGRQNISGTGDRMRGIAPQPSSVQSSASRGISDPVTSSFYHLAGLNF